MSRYLKSLGNFTGQNQARRSSPDDYLFSITDYERAKFLQQDSFGEEMLSHPGPSYRYGSGYFQQEEYQRRLDAYNEQRDRRAYFNANRFRSDGLAAASPDEMERLKAEHDNIMIQRRDRLGNQTGGVRGGVARNPFNLNMMKGPQSSPPRRRAPSSGGGGTTRGGAGSGAGGLGGGGGAGGGPYQLL